MGYYSVGQTIAVWWEHWGDDNVLHRYSGDAVIVASSRTKKVLPIYEAMRILGVHDLQKQTWHRVTKADIENGDAEYGSEYGLGASGSGWIKVALPVNPEDS